jgi:hypothetical protein
MRHSRPGVRTLPLLALVAGLAAAWPLAGRAASQAGQAAAPAAPAQAAAAQDVPAQAATATGSKNWIGHEAEFEEYLRTAPVTRIEDVPIGVTKPRRAYFDGNGPIKRAAWKALKPGMHNGFYDSYKSEIAAYEMDKLLNMHMVPPVVERRIEKDMGALVQWVEDIKMWKITDPIAGPDQNAWNKQVIAMKMFDNLIGNTDRNQGNLLYDSQFNLILIDHSRAFTSTRDLPMPLTRIWKDLWDRMLALTPEQVDATVTPWLPGKGEAKAIFERREKMKKVIDKLIAEKGPAAIVN